MIYKKDGALAPSWFNLKSVTHSLEISQLSLELSSLVSQAFSHFNKLSFAQVWNFCSGAATVSV